MPATERLGNATKEECDCLNLLSIIIDSWHGENTFNSASFVLLLHLRSFLVFLSSCDSISPEHCCGNLVFCLTEEVLRFIGLSCAIWNLDCISNFCFITLQSVLISIACTGAHVTRRRVSPDSARKYLCAQDKAHGVRPTLRASSQSRVESLLAG